MICLIELQEILKIWRNDLWPNRISEITGTSAMCFLGGYDLENMKVNPICIGYKQDDKIIGVNSIHACNNGSYRSRGLFVYESFRGQGIGIKLLNESVRIARENYAEFLWSYPKQSSWKTYSAAGFNLSSDWEISENGINAYCIYQF